MLLRHPRGAVFAAAVVVGDGPAARERLLHDDADDVHVVFLDRMLLRDLEQELEVDVRAVNVAVGAVASDNDEVFHLGLGARADGLVDFADLGPAGGNFAGVDASAHVVHLLARLLELVGDIVARLDPRFDGLRAEALGPVLFDNGVHARAGCFGNGLRAVSQKQHQRLAVLRDAAEEGHDLRRVVQAHDGGAVAFDHDLADGVESVLHGADLVGAHPALVGLILEDFYRDLGDEAERALAAQKQVAEVRAGRAARNVFDADNLTVRHDSLEADEQVFDAAVERRPLTDGAGRNQAAHLREGEGLGAVPGRVALGVKLILERLQRHAAAGRDLHVDFIDFIDAGDLAAVEHDRALNGLDALRDGRAAGAWRGLDLVGV